MSFHVRKIFQVIFWAHCECFFCEGFVGQDAGFIRICSQVLACWVESLAQSIEWQHCVVDSGIWLHHPDPDENLREGVGQQQKLQKLKITCLTSPMQASRFCSCGLFCLILRDLGHLGRYLGPLSFLISEAGKSQYA